MVERKFKTERQARSFCLKANQLAGQRMIASYHPEGTGFAVTLRLTAAEWNALQKRDPYLPSEG